jgi:PAS domain S-box-containing protein
MTPLARADRRMRDLCEISTLLTRFEGADKTLEQVVAVTARSLPACNAVLVLERAGALRSHVWKTNDVSEERSLASLERARDGYAWFKGQSGPRALDHDRRPAPRLPPQPTDDVILPAAPARGHPVLLVPLVVQGGDVFGVMQLEACGALAEADVWFVNAAANQMAVGVDRQAGADEAEARVRAQLDFTRALTGSLGEGVLATDLDACITFLNPAAERLLGWSEATLLGTIAPDVLRVQCADGSMLDDADCPLVCAMKTERRIVSDDHSFLGRDGVPVPVSYTSAPIRTGGRLSGAVIVFRDVLDVKRSEKAQRLLASASAALAESLDGSTTLDALVRCVVPAFADVCFVDEVEDGTAPAPALGPSVFVESVSDVAIDDLVTSAAHRARLRESGARSLLVVPLSVRGRTFGVLTFGMTASGRRYATYDIAVADELGRRAAIAIDNARLHQATVHAVRDRQDILAMVSHDLRSPLNTVAMAADNLTARRETAGADDTEQHLVELIARAAKRMERMTTDLLDAASIEAGHLALVSKPVAVEMILRDALEDRPLAAARSVDLVAAPVDPLVLVRCDRDRIRQVFSNLIGNAIKFTPAGGVVELSVETTERVVRFVVADSGAGIAVELVPHLFERYRQAEATASKGRGLGLFIAKGIVEAHGGSIGVDTSRGRGTTFCFELPRALPTVATTARPRDDEPGSHSIAR